MTTKSERDQMQAVERRAFDALSALAYGLGHGIIGSVAMRTGDKGSLVSLAPKNVAQADPKAIQHYAGETLLHALLEAGDATDHLIHKMHAEGAPVQDYLNSRGEVIEARKVSLIIAPGGRN